MAFIGVVKACFTCVAKGSVADQEHTCLHCVGVSSDTSYLLCGDARTRIITERKSVGKWRSERGGRGGGGG